MSEFIPNSFQVPNRIVDEIAPLISPKALSCLIFIIRKTRGWNKASDRISVSQFKRFLKTKDDRTIQKVIDELEFNHLIQVHRELGKINEYSLGKMFEPPANNGGGINESYPQPPTENPPANNEGTSNKCSEPPAKNVGGTTRKKCGSTKDTIQNTNTKGACDLFIENYPAKVRELDIREQWPRLNRKFNLDENIGMILQDIKKRLETDRKWVAGFYPDPIKYIEGARWNDEIVPVRSVDSAIKPDWMKIPAADDDMWPWAKKHGYPAPGQLYYPQYRRKLERAVEERMRKGS